MDYRDRDAALEKLGKLGQAGGLPIVDPKLAIDELQRRTSTVAQIVAAMLADMFRGPRYGDGADLFMIDARPASPTYNLITDPALAAREGLGSSDNIAVFRHGRGFVLDRAELVHCFLNAPAVGPPNRIGQWQHFSWDDNRTIFQLDVDAVDQEAVMIFSCFSSKVVPANKIPARATGAARGKYGYAVVKDVS